MANPTLIHIPRASDQIARTIATLRHAQFEQDPLFDAGDSFRISLCNSAVKREGPILEAAIKDAIAQKPTLRLLADNQIKIRKVDVQFEIRKTGQTIALEIKRGSLHDSTKIRQFMADLQNFPSLLKTTTFHIVFISGNPPLKQGLTLKDLARLYDLNATPYILAARQQYSTLIKSVLRERGL